MDSKTCYQCGASAGELHARGCDVEQCPYCGRQLLSCDHSVLFNDDAVPQDDRMPWDGFWPGVTECRAFGWFARLVPGRGWVPCHPNEPGAREDLNRLHMEATWDRDQKRFVRKT